MRLLNKNILLCSFFVLLLYGCGPKVHFIPVSDNIYPGKSDNFDVLIFWGEDKPDMEYKVIGMVFIETQCPILFPPEVPDSKLINSIKKEARKRGADAVLDFKIDSGFVNIPDPDTIIDRRKTKRVEAKLVSFVKTNLTK